MRPRNKTALNGVFLAIEAILTACLIGCSTPRIDTTKICPEYPPLPKINCPKPKPFQVEICETKTGKWYICLDASAAEKIKYNLLIQEKCVEQYEKLIDYYNHVILNGKN